MRINIELPCKSGDKVWIADKELNKVLKFEVNCIKIFEDNVTAHGWRESGCGKFNIPIEYSLKHFNKRVVFKTKAKAKQWLEQSKLRGE